ncbi:ankyrin repeat-containing domain protein [Mycena capillaripes]|nr:ankyrin repeat-containing domain protein [Mycena capillaripes]
MHRLVDIQLQQDGVAENVVKVAETVLKDEVSKWLNAPDSKDKHTRSCDLRHEFTGLWLFQHEQFIHWQDHPGELLWIKGQSGTGKTILSSTIIDQLFRDRKSHQTKGPIAIVYFYFQFGNHREQSMVDALRSLVLQLSAQCPAPYKTLSQQHDSYAGQKTLTYRELLDLFQKLLRELHRTYVVLDALDECKSEEHDRVVEFVQTTLAWPGIRLHFVVTSQIRDVFATSFHSLEHLLQITLDKDITSSDITVYVQSKLALRSKLKKWNSKSEIIVPRIVERSAGMFRLADCLIRELERCDFDSQLETTLQALPNDLHAIYSRWLTPCPEIYRKLLSWVVYSAEPLTVAHLEDTIAFNFSTPEYIFDPGLRPIRGTFVESLSGLVSVDPSGSLHSDSTVRLAHSSVRDYLLLPLEQHPQGCKSCPVVSEQEAQTLIAHTCVCYLLHFADADHPLNERTFPDYPLATYAAKYWSYHFSRCHDRTTLLRSTMRLLQSGSRQYTALNCLYNVDEPWQSPRWMINIPEPLYLCSAMGYTDVVQLLLDHDTNVGAIGGKYGTALHAACTEGNIAIVQLLLERDADVNAIDKQFGSPLRAACAEGHTEIVKLLLEKGADINATDRRLGSVLQAACAKGIPKPIQLLLDSGVDINAASGKYGTALQAGCTEGNTEAVELLLQRNADVNTTGGKYGTALQAACYEGHATIVRLLLENGANVNATGGKCGSPFKAASARGNTDIIGILLEKGAEIENPVV